MLINNPIIIIIIIILHYFVDGVSPVYLSVMKKKTNQPTKKPQTAMTWWEDNSDTVLHNSEMALNLTSARKSIISSTFWIACLKNCIHSANFFFFLPV